MRGSSGKSKLPALTIPTPPLRVHCRQKGFLSEWKGATTELFKHQRRGNRQPAAEEYSTDENYGSAKQELKEREALKETEEGKKQVMGGQQRCKREYMVLGEKFLVS